MDVALKFTVISAIVAGTLGAYPNLFPYQQQLVQAPYFYQHPSVVQPVFGYNVRPQAPQAVPWAQHFYSSPPDNTYRGFAYQTQYNDGGSSQVVYVTGPESQQLMRQSIEQFRQIPLGHLSALRSSAEATTPAADKTTATTATTPVTVSTTSAPQAGLPAATLPLAPLLVSHPLIPHSPFAGLQVPLTRVPFPYHPFVQSFNVPFRLINATHAQVRPATAPLETASTVTQTLVATSPLPELALTTTEASIAASSDDSEASSADDSVVTSADDSASADDTAAADDSAATSADDTAAAGDSAATSADDTAAADDSAATSVDDSAATSDVDSVASSPDDTAAASAAETEITTNNMLNLVFLNRIGSDSDSLSAPTTTETSSEEVIASQDSSTSEEPQVETASNDADASETTTEASADETANNETEETTTPGATNEQSEATTLS